MRQVLGPGTRGRPRGLGWRGRWEGGLCWGTQVTPWLIHVNVWQNPLKCCEVISLQLIKNKRLFLLNIINFSFFLTSFIYFFLFLIALGLLCCSRAFSSCRARGLLSGCSALASRCRGFSCGVWARGRLGSVVVASGH